MPDNDTSGERNIGGKKPRVYPVTLASKGYKVIYVEGYSRKLAVEAADRYLASMLPAEDVAQKRAEEINRELDNIRKGIAVPPAAGENPHA